MITDFVGGLSGRCLLNFSTAQEMGCVYAMQFDLPADVGLRPVSTFYSESTCDFRNAIAKRDYRF